MRFFMVFCVSVFGVFIKAKADDCFVLDNFNDRDDRNSLGLYWFYFSDVNDSGTSQIHNADYLGNGAYSRVVPLRAKGKSPSEGLDTNDYCASLEFTIGDTVPQGEKGDKLDMFQFVGVGTDLSSLTEGVDISGFDSICFDVFNGAGKTIEIIFNIISDYGLDETSSSVDHFNWYHCEFRISNDMWEHKVVRKQDLQLYQWSVSKRWKNLKGDESRENYLKKAYKFTWQIIGGWNCSLDTSDKGVLYLDNVIIYPDLFPAGARRLTYSRKIPSAARTGTGSLSFDLRGRILDSRQISPVLVLTGQKTCISELILHSGR